MTEDIIKQAISWIKKPDDMPLHDWLVANMVADALTIIMMVTTDDRARAIGLLDNTLDAVEFGMATAHCGLWQDGGMSLVEHRKKEGIELAVAEGE